MKNPNYGGTQGGLIPYTFSDTSSANSLAGYLKAYCGAVIYCTDVQALYYRSCYNGYKWVQIQPAGSPLGSNPWIIGGNSGLFTSPVDPQKFGLITNQGLQIITNNIPRLYLPKSGIGAETGNSVGIGIDPTDSNRITYFSGGGSVNIYNSDGTLTSNRTVSLSNKNLSFNYGAGNMTFEPDNNRN